ncbi:laccase-15-like protein, partial [Tanacetum coccineum]
MEVGTLWWHAHSDWSRATVHGAIVVQPRPGEWWNEDIMQVPRKFITSGGAPRDSDAYTTNVQPGDFLSMLEP